MISVAQGIWEIKQMSLQFVSKILATSDFLWRVIVKVVYDDDGCEESDLDFDLEVSREVGGVVSRRAG